MQFQDKLVLITGGGSGIGRATAQAFAREGARVLAVDVNPATADETRTMIEGAGGRCHSYTADVGDLNAMQVLADSVHREHGALDVLVNNAGIGVAGRYLQTAVATEDRVIRINIKGVMHGCRVFLPKMVERGSGHVVNLSSMAGYFAPPDMPIYAMSKFAVLGFSEALRADLRHKGVGVSAICPGVVNTNITRTSTYEGNTAGWKDGAVNFYVKRNYGPEGVARGILRAVRRNIAVLPVTPESWVMWYTKRFFPWLARALAGQQMPFMK